MYSVGEAGAKEMTWMQVPGEKLLEPVVNVVIVAEHLFLFSHALVSTPKPVAKRGKKNPNSNVPKFQITIPYWPIQSCL